MKNVLILHGAENNSQGNWFPWLKQELEKKGYKAWAPDLPNSSVPVLKDWMDTIFSNNEWKFDEDSVIIGHSMGGTLTLRILEKLPDDVRIAKAVLVATPVELGTKPETFPYKRDLVTSPFNWDKIKKSAKEFYFIHSDNDQYECGIDQGEILKKNLGGELIIKPGEAHFNLEKGPEYKKFPLLLELIP